MGFGMLFEGITLMKSAIAPLAESPAFSDFLSQLNNPALALVFGVAFTALLQSSSSSTVIFQAFAVQGLLSYDVSVYLVIGAAIGSVTPNLLAGPDCQPGRETERHPESGIQPVPGRDPDRADQHFPADPGF